MNTPLKNLFKTQLENLTGFEFQKIVVEIFRLIYGQTDFTDLRLKSDKGCDGIIESEKRIIACYGPEKNQDTNRRKKAFKDKAKEDFKQFQNHWQDRYINWSIVINHPIDPYYDEVVKRLSSNASVIGLNQLVAMIDDLKSYQKRKLGKTLSINKQYFSMDYIGEILDDLLKEDEPSGIRLDYNPKDLIEIKEKIKLNYSEHDINDAVNKYGLMLDGGLFVQINDVLYGYEDNDIKKIKSRAIDDFNEKTNSKLAFKDRLATLTQLYLEKYSCENDDEYIYYIRGLLLYFFEQCLIGNRTEQEG